MAGEKTERGERGWRERERDQEDFYEIIIIIAVLLSIPTPLQKKGHCDRPQMDGEEGGGGGGGREDGEGGEGM